MWFLITGSLVVGTFAEMAIYSHILKTKTREQPINILILSEHLVRHTCSIVFLAPLSISLMFDGSIGQMISLSWGTVQPFAGFILLLLLSWLHILIKMVLE